MFAIFSLSKEGQALMASHALSLTAEVFKGKTTNSDRKLVIRGYLGSVQCLFTLLTLAELFKVALKLGLFFDRSLYSQQGLLDLIIFFQRKQSEQYNEGNSIHQFIRLFRRRR